MRSRHFLPLRAVKLTSVLSPKSPCLFSIKTVQKVKTRACKLADQCNTACQFYFSSSFVGFCWFTLSILLIGAGLKVPIIVLVWLLWTATKSMERYAGQKCLLSNAISNAEFQIVGMALERHRSSRKVHCGFTTRPSIN